MVVNLRNQKISLTEIQNGKINQNNLSDFESEAIKFLQQWSSEQKVFIQTTSGSTGKPKKIQLTRDQLNYSAATTLEAIDLDNQLKTSLLCINPNFIGGKMVMVRAVSKGMDLTIVEPSELVESVKNIESIDLVSLVPLQVEKLLAVDQALLTKFKTILIGGAPMSNTLIKKLVAIPDVRFRQTYGMSETASNVALKDLKSENKSFEIIGDASIAQDSRGCLKIKGSVTKDEWIQTNDLVQIIDNQHFEWKGRADFIINTGGVKVSPEKVEEALESQIEVPFFVGGLPDKLLGTKVVLILESYNDKLPALDFSMLPVYDRPKEILKLNSFEYTSSGKIDRNLTLKKIAS
ncbi:MAG: AMP-binding protein [Cyclobacteriaceae bacterium]